MNGESLISTPPSYDGTPQEGNLSTNTGDLKVEYIRLGRDAPTKINVGRVADYTKKWRDKPHPKQGMGWTKSLRYENKIYLPRGGDAPTNLPPNMNKMRYIVDKF